MRRQDTGATLHYLRIVSESPVLAATSDLLCLRMNGHDAPRLARSHIGFPFFVQCKVPTHNRASPILQHSGKGRRPFTPIRLEVRTGDDRAAFGPLRMLIWEGLVYTRHGIDGTFVCMPCNAVHISVDLRLT